MDQAFINGCRSIGSCSHFARPKLLQPYFSKEMDDYDFHAETLRPNRVYADSKSTKIVTRQKANTERTKSKQKAIVTSFSKKLVANTSSVNSPPSKPQINLKNKESLGSPRKSNCQSEYYIKTAETKTELDPLQLQDQIRVKEGQLQILTGRLAKAEKQINQLTAENRLKSQRIESLEKQMSLLLAKSMKSLQVQHFGTDLAYECEKARQDSRRLLKMLEQTTQYEYFAKFALLENGVDFLSHPNLTKKSYIDVQLAKKPIHFCVCNKEFISQSSFWVPEKVYTFGKEFIKERKGELTKSEYELLLYELNRLWRERQKKIVNTLNAQKARQIEKYKRRQASYHSLQKNGLQR